MDPHPPHILWHYGQKSGLAEVDILGRGKGGGFEGNGTPTKNYWPAGKRNWRRLLTEVGLRRPPLS
jgi:hypothetical protein